MKPAAGCIRRRRKAPPPPPSVRSLCGSSRAWRGRRRGAKWREREAPLEELLLLLLLLLLLASPELLTFAFFSFSRWKLPFVVVRFFRRMLHLASAKKRESIHSLL